MEGPKKQHYVPKLYLKSFAIPDGKNQVWVYDKHTGKLFKRNINDVLLQNDFYTLEEYKDKYLWEKLYSNILEPDYAEQLNFIIEKCNNYAIPTSVPIIDFQFKVDFSFSLTMQFLRTPVMRKYLAGILPTVFDSVMEDELQLNTKTSNSVINVLKTMDPNDGKTVKDLSFKTFLFQAPMLKDFVDSFSRREWIFCVSSRPQYITSDNPIVTINNLSRTAGFMESAFNSQHTGFVFSLTPTICLLMISPAFGIIGKHDRNRVFITNDNDPWFTYLRNLQFQNAERLLISQDKAYLEL